VNYDPNDPTNRAEFDAYEESQKREPIAERADDLGNREPWWIWTAAAATLLAAVGIFAHALGAC
jgi:hypothetical protein